MDIMDIGLDVISEYRTAHTATLAYTSPPIVRVDNKLRHNANKLNKRRAANKRARKQRKG